MTAALTTTAPPTRDITWLRHFWLISAGTLAFVALFALVMGLATSVGALAGGALLLAAMGMWLTLARRRVREGQEARYVILAGMGQYVLMLSLLPLVPELAAIIVPAVLVPVFVASSYLSVSAMTRYVVAVWCFCVAYALAAYLLAQGAHDELLRLASSGSFGATPGTLAAHLGRMEAADATQLLGAIVVTAFMLALLHGYARANERARFLAAHDGLTRLPTRALFMDRLEHALERGKRRGTTAAVVFMDVDAFKAINDGHGHGYGDEVLRRVAARISQTTRASDTTARLGGDEFALLLEDLNDASEAEVVARRLHRAMADPIEMPEGSFPVVLSMGIAFSGMGGETADALLRSADDAMYESKRQGRGEMVAYQPAMRVASAERVAVKRSFEGVVERGELRIQFQPLIKILAGDRDGAGPDTRHGPSSADSDVDHRHGQSSAAPAAAIVGVEALVRWEDPERGWRLPAQFVSLAEETGDIVPIGRWVLQEAARHAAQWRRSTPERDLRVAVNVSGRQLEEDSFDDEVVDVLDATGLPPHGLVLEISEHLLERDTPKVESMLARLHDRGVRLAIDDFGTGSSSLGSLKGFPVDMMKIDRSLLTNAVDDRIGTAVLRAAVDVGLALDAEVVAEGIETPEQLRLLRSMQCEVGQGYLFARPLDPPAMEALLRADTRTWESLLGRETRVVEGRAPADAERSHGTRPRWPKSSSARAGLSA